MIDSSNQGHDVGGQHAPLTSLNDASPLDAALAYARRGWRVLPIWPVLFDGRTATTYCSCPAGDRCERNVGKHPWQGLGLKHATINQDVIRSWFRSRDDLNVAVALHASGLLALDRDERNGGPLPLEWGVDIGDYAVQESGSEAGEHYVVRADLGDVKLPKELLPGVDVKYDGYVVVAPSNHRSGARYRWLGDHEPGPISTELTARLVAIKERRTGGEGGVDPGGFDWSRLRELSIAPGQQDNTLQAAAGWLREFDAPDVFALNVLGALTDRFENEPGRAEWTQADVVAKWENAKQAYEPNQRDKLEVPVALQEFVASLGPQLTDGQRRALAREADQRWARRTLNEREETEARGERPKRDGAAYAALERPRPVLPGRLAAEVNLLGGPSEAGKSLLARDWALEVAASGRNVLWIASEGMDDFDERWEAHPLWSNDVAARLFVLDEPVTIVHDVEVDWLLDEYRGERPALVVFDLIYDMGIRDDNSYEYLNPMFRSLKRLSAAWDAATLALGHNGHGRERRFRGSSSWRQRAYTEWHMAESVLSCEKSKIGRKPPPRAYAINFPTIHWIDLPGGDLTDDDRERVIREHVQEFPDLSQAERGRQLAPILGLSADRVRKLIARVR